MPTRTKLGNPAYALIMLQGEYGRPRQLELRTKLAEGTPFELVLLDMRDVTFLDAAALTEFIALKKRMPDPGIIRLIGAMPHIRRLFHTTGLSKLFELHDSVSSAASPSLAFAPAFATSKT